MGSCTLSRWRELGSNHACAILDATRHYIRTIVHVVRIAYSIRPSNASQSTAKEIINHVDAFDEFNYSTIHPINAARVFTESSSGLTQFGRMVNPNLPVALSLSFSLYVKACHCVLNLTSKPSKLTRECKLLTTGRLLEGIPQFW